MIFPGLRRAAWVVACGMWLVISYVHFGLVSVNVSFVTLLVIMTSDVLIALGLILRKNPAWHLANLGALHLALRKPFFDYAFVLGFGAPYVISGMLVFSLWVCREEFNIRGWQWLNTIASLALGFCILLTYGYYFPRLQIEYADPPPPYLVRIIDGTGLQVGGALLLIYASGIVVIVAASGGGKVQQWYRTRGSARKR